jgi:hypothetical protein
MIQSVIDADRERREQERLAEQRRREEEALQRQAARLAEQLGLPPAETGRIASLLTEERARIEAATASFRGRWQDADREAAREALRAVRDWRRGEVTRIYGADVAQKLDELDDGRERRAQRLMQERDGRAGPGGS